MREGGGGGRAEVILWHTHGATARDKLMGAWHACLLRQRLDERDGAGGEAGEADLTAAHELARKCWPRVEEALKAAKWDLETAHIDGDGGCLERPR